MSLSCSVFGKLPCVWITLVFPGSSHVLSGAFGFAMRLVQVVCQIPVHRHTEKTDCYLLCFFLSLASLYLLRLPGALAKLHFLDGDSMQNGLGSFRILACFSVMGPVFYLVWCLVYG